MNSMSPVTILLVEDDLGDQKLIKTSLAQQKITNCVHIVDSGEDALSYLERSKAGDPECPMADLILLDLNMPGMGGKEFLRCVKGDPDLDTIPVVILTTSDAERDIVESYKLHASGYVQKPPTLEGFKQVMSELEEYWFVICRRACKD